MITEEALREHLWLADDLEDVILSGNLEEGSSVLWRAAGALREMVREIRYRDGL